MSAHTPSMNGSEAAGPVTQAYWKPDGFFASQPQQGLPYAALS